ncbi:MAG: hypothetical protein ACRC7G_13175 [Beijerinckiaceae bacterium]
MTAALHQITLHLAREKAFPDGSMRHGYEIVAPLDGSGRIDAAVFREKRNACVVRRFWGDEPPVRGHLVHRPGGVDGATWGIDYDTRSHADDEVGFRLGEHAFTVGEYVSIRDPDGDMRTFRVAASRPA